MLCGHGNSSSMESCSLSTSWGRTAGGAAVEKISSKGGRPNISHLVLTKAEGEKFRFALKHDVVVVNDMWLIESAIAGGLWGDWASLLLMWWRGLMCALAMEALAVLQ